MKPANKKSQNKTYDTTEMSKDKQEIFRSMYENSKVDESCFEDFQ